MTDAEQKIIEGCITGKRRSQNTLYNKYLATLFRLCMRYSNNKEEAEDILQEGFIKIFLNIKSFRKEGSFEGWLKRIMVNTAITHFKQNLKHQFHTDVDEIEEFHTVEEQEKGNEFPVNIPTEKLMGLIQSLPKGYKMVFNLHVFEKYTHKEIAEILDVSVNTSKSQLSKARKSLATKIYKLYGVKEIR